MIKRYLKIENFRNIGISEKQTLLLNTSIEKGKLGSLIMLVGPNNSGKSNCLDALEAFSKDGRLTDDDTPDFYNHEGKPKVSLIIQENDLHIGAFKTGSTYQEVESFYKEKDKKAISTVSKSVIITKEAISFVQALLSITPYETHKKLEITAEARNFAIAIINRIANNWGTAHLRSQVFHKDTYDTYMKYTRRNVWDDKAIGIISPAYEYVKKQWGVRWKQNVGNQIVQYTDEQIDKMVEALSGLEEIIPAKLSKKSIVLLKQYQKSSKKETKGEARFTLLAKNLLLLANNTDIEKSKKTNTSTKFSEDLRKLMYFTTSTGALPDYTIYNIAELLKEAHEYLLVTVGVRYYVNGLSTNKEELDNLFSFFTKLDSQSNEINKKINALEIKKHQKEIQEIYQYGLSIYGDKFCSETLGIDISEYEVKDYMYQFSTETETQIAPQIVDWEKNHDIKLQPNIIRFKETEINQSSLTIKPEEVVSSDFFNVLFKAINYDKNNLVKLYDDLKSENKFVGMLRYTEADINAKLELIADQFNRLFFIKENKYIFKIYLESEKIEFDLHIGSLPLNLNKQSTGFRWFFNFYFTVIAQKNLHRGDIIIMDEPATNLHVSGIQELRTFIKQYAKTSELTFVISTHSPFMIDIDSLEEVRVVSRVGNEAVINNKFQVIDDQDVDTLRPIKDALTVGRHILLDPNKKTIFVEGMTDYCFLTTYKRHFGDIAKGLHFLPIQGLKKEDILEKILRIDKLPTILVDDDHYGNGLKKQAENYKYKEFVEVITLSEIDSSFTDVESLFDDMDKLPDKKFETAVTFKLNFDLDGVSTKTTANFKKLFENISL